MFGALARRRDAAVVTTLTAVTLLAEWPVLQGHVVAGLDSLTQFYPWHELVGTALREGRLPGWNPHTMAGGPLAGNPLSGWAYLPAMLAFTFLPLESAAIAYQVTHALLATLATYALARVLGLGGFGASLAALAYGQSGLIAVEAACCFAFVSVGAWLPLLLLGAELAIHASSWAGRIRSWGLAALALSQILAAWLGQGSYYALLVFGSFVAFRVLMQGFRAASGWPSSVRQACLLPGWLVLHGAVPFTLGLGLATAGLLPRIEFNLLSSLAGGYGGEDQHVGGWTVPEWRILAEPGFWYVGLVVIGLAVLAPWLARRRPLTWYLLAVGTTLLLLAMPAPSPVHDLFGLLPGFSRLHPHLPDRIITVFMLVPGILAGLTVDALARVPRVGLVVTVMLIGAAVADLRTARDQSFAGYAAADGVHRLMPVDLDTHYAPTPAARFLQARLLEEGPSRSLGYAPDPNGLAYTQRFSDPATVLLGVNNRAVSDRLLDVQGYDAIHLARFDAYLRAANRESQNYHNADLFARGLRSPLLDLLSARYVVTPSPATSADASLLAPPRFRTVFDDGTTRVLRNEDALPWAWIVYEARAATADDALDSLDRGLVDPRRTVLLEPPLASPLEIGGPRTALSQQPIADVAELAASLSLRGATANPPADGTVSLVAFEADRLLLRTRSYGDGILVLSEVAYPGWEATVDGVPTPIYVANGLLRALALPAGDHVVELRFVTPTLRAGVIITLVTALALLGSCLAPVTLNGWRRRADGRCASP